ncbi:non-heme iron oxygenase ferredoxin subunit [Iamia majanohamensis]|uniref:Non-heme iron oxygenase ferredoxin subunit n=1 Tax=Iamia majanohamensis TaxID=467976 RepID=A0AAF0BWP5_9ACTN|nr:non-heme iron oxygenase ferredoxin subunit [Iamia majanohamensis]WCO68303.1 non-heme iron oxygenase ferredoxin subunit [Iamia majanohamensis]
MPADRLVRALEHATALDRPADAVAGAVGSWLGPGRVKDLLSGTWFGHAVHPALVAVPIGAWITASWLDAFGGPDSRPAARTAVGFGTLAAVPAVLTGGSDWAEVDGAERRVGFVHALANSAAVGLYAGSWQARRRGRHAVGVGLALAGAGLAGAGGWLGGHLTYAAGVGVDTTAFLSGPSEWTEVAAESDLGEDEPTAVQVGEVPLVLVRRGGVVHAVNDRCTHRGAPLHEGPVVGDCLECPWHGSRFGLAGGEVRRGPATRPQPVFEVAVDGGRVLVRRTDEQRALRLNPVASGGA